ncbi:unnamed protein product [Porites lobata]|uniref:Uncharacterized protein n=1 Tax=Porites lobata TaxID=104759 RepID=A0ABN8NQR1_9CNID|nr:unnamed protein product [Porites lobata]
MSGCYGDVARSSQVQTILEQQQEAIQLMTSSIQRDINSSVNYVKKEDWPGHPIQLPELSGEHKELKPNVGQANVIVCDESFAARFSRYSSWDSLRKAIAWLLRLKNYLSSYVTRFPGIVIGGPLSVAGIGVTESCLVRIVQREATQERSDVI